MLKWHEKAQIGLLHRYFNVHGCEVRAYADRLAITPRDQQQILSWETLQAIKTYVWGDTPAFELYPRPKDVVNEWNTRHLWRDRAISLQIESTCTHPEFQRT